MIDKDSSILAYDYNMTKYFLIIRSDESQKVFRPYDL